MFDDEKELDEYIEWLDNEVSGRYEQAEVDLDEYAEPEEVETAAASDTSEKVYADLTGEREQVLESELYLDDHPEEKPPENEAEEQQETVKREMLKTAITRIENSARTVRDFENVVSCWDKLEKNEARRLRDHQILRGDVPLEYDKAMDGAIIPESFMEPRWKQLMSGSYIELIHDCPFEMDELTADVAISNMMRNLKDDHKEIFYWHFIRQLSCTEVGWIRGQTDRNIRKTRGVILRKLRKQLQKVLEGREHDGYGLTLRQKAFLENMRKAALDDDKDS